MALPLPKVVAILQVSRVGLVFTAVSNIWVVAVLSRAMGGGGGGDLMMWEYLLTTFGVAGGMYTFGMVLNDVLDMRRDRLFAPGKPLPSRRLEVTTAMGMAVGALLASISGSVPLGAVSTLVCLGTAALALFYDGPGKHVAGLGILTLGFIRAGNMLVADPRMAYLWPVWLTMTHVMGLSALCHSLEEKRPRLTGPQVWMVTVVWALASVAMIGWMKGHGSLTMVGWPGLWVGPTVAGVVFLAMAFATVKRANRAGATAVDQKAAGMLLMKRGLMWLIVYDASWMVSAKLWWQAALLGGLLPVTWLIMAGVRVLKAMAEGEVGFER